jgi:hypothetical protein
VGRFSVAVVVVLAASGCVHEGVAEFEVEPERPAAEPEPTITRDVEVAYDGPGDETPVPNALALWPSGRPPPDPVLFRLGAGLGALGHIDLAPCREEGLQSGYLHMRVTFQHGGRVVRAAVQTPTEPPATALACISEQLEVASVPSFDGDDVTLSKSFFVN